MSQEQNDLVTLVKKIPVPIKERHLSRWGRQAVEWYAALPYIIAALLRKWKLSFHSMAPGDDYNNIVFFAQNPVYGDVVVKVVLPVDPGFILEVKALNYFNGCNTCMLYDVDYEHRAVLLERIKPGYSLHTIKDSKKRLWVTTKIMAGLHKQVTDDGNFACYEQLLPDIFHKARTRMCPGEFILDLMEKAVRIFPGVLACGKRRVLLHGDLHQGNILYHGTAFKAIDPKGIVGFPFMDTAQFILNEPINYKNIDSITGLITAMAELTPYSEELLTKWLFIEVVIRTLWNFEDFGVCESDPGISLCRKLLQLCEKERWLL